ncbi:MAG: DNA recombination protein RmuC, partial [Candidatus Nealsonbacteria bacterium]|nr:DNA recombination protein RmuC [Candidatus Nealsonbacteria bacterium]
IVDAAVFVDKRIIPIDSKFSLENYNRIIESVNPNDKKKYEAAFVNDLKTRIDETSKYVRPEEKTTDFAFMFIPSEAVYYDLIKNKVGAVTRDTESLITYAYKKKVIVVSANTFVAFLQTVLQGLKNQKISEEAHQIIKEMEKIGKHMYAYSEYMNRLGGHLDSTVSSYERARKEFEKLDKDVVRITDSKSQIKMKEVERPMLDE